MPATGTVAVSTFVSTRRPGKSKSDTSDRTCPRDPGFRRVSTAALSRSGTLVHARGHEWVVLPDSTGELLMLRPVGGFDEEVTGVLPAIEPVESATFRLPGRQDLGDFTSGRLLREAARLSTRAAAGPFRSFGRIAVEPRPYQLVPLDDGAQARSGAHAHRRRRWHRQDHRGVPHRARAARPWRDPPHGRALPPASRRTVAAGACWRSSTSRRSWCSRAPSNAWSGTCPLGTIGLRPAPPSP